MSNCPVSFEDISHYDCTGVQPASCTIATVIKTEELLISISKSKNYSDQQKLVTQAFDLLCSDIDWSTSFSKPIVIYSDEVLRVEILISLHEYFRKKCCDIENIWVVSTGNFNLLKPWWKTYCDLFAIKSFNIQEWPTSDTLFLSELYKSNSDPDWEELFTQKYNSVCYLFSVYGGSYPKLDRCYLTLRLCELADQNIVDFMGTFEPKQSMIDYTENITYFKNQKEVDIISKLYDQHVVDLKLSPTFDSTVYPPKFNEPISWKGTQWLLDQQCVFNVARETNDSECVPDFTEKTLRAFCHFCLVLPVGYKSHQALKNLGFWFPETEIDYSYCENPNYHDRVVAIVENLKKIQTSTKKYQDLVKQHRLHLMHNAKLAWSMVTKKALDH